MARKSLDTLQTHNLSWIDQRTEVKAGNMNSKKERDPTVGNMIHE